MISVKGHRVLISPDEVELKTKAGLIIAADKKVEQSAQQYGTVVGVGANAWEDYSEPFAKVGDYVIYSQYAGKVIHNPEDGKGYLIINDVDILATTDKPEKEVGELDDVLAALDTRREAV